MRTDKVYGWRRGMAWLGALLWAAVVWLVVGWVALSLDVWESLFR